MTNRFRASAHRSDLLASLTVVALLAPESVAYAQIAGVPPQYGLVAAPLTLLAYAVLGRSKVLAVGVTAATAVISGATISRLGLDPLQRAEFSAALALSSGAVLVVTGALRCGWIVRFLSPAALTGFLSGLAAVVIVRQSGVFLDVFTAGNAFTRAGQLLMAWPRWELVSLVVGGGTLVLLLVLEAKLPRLPNTLIVLALAWLVSATTDLQGHGVAVVGAIPAVLPTWNPPQLAVHDWLRLAGGALGLALVVFVMSYSVGTRTASPNDPLLDANREMVAVGVANVVAGLVGGLASGGSPSASGAAREAGARSRAAAAAAAAVMLGVVAFCTPAFTLLPEPALAAVVIAAVRHFLAGPALRRYLHRDRPSFAVAAAALVGVLAFDLLPGLLLAVGLSLTVFIARASQLRISELGQLVGTSAFLAVESHPAAVPIPGLVIVRPDGALFFANVIRATDFVDRVRRSRPDSRVILMDLTATYDLELAALDALRGLRDRLARDGTELWFVHLDLAAADAVRRSELAAVPTFTDIQTAVATFAGDVTEGSGG